MARGPLGALPKLSRSARRALVACALLAAGSAVALVVQAIALSGALAGIVARTESPGQLRGALLLLAAAVLARAVLGWATEAAAARAAAGAKEELRAALLDRALRLGPEWITADGRPDRGPAGLTALATKGLDALDAYFTRYLPALVTATVVPPLVGLWVLLSDWTSAVLIAVTVPLIPVFAIMIGWYTERRTAQAADATARLSGYLLELVRALPVLTAFRRAGAQVQAVRRVGDRYRQATMTTLRVAFLSALVLEVIATLSVALVAVDIGLRLLAGGLGLATGLLVLVLAPECYLPLRAAGAAHHASEDGLEAVRRVEEILAEPVPSRAAAATRPVPPVADHPLRVEGLSVRRRDAFAPDGLSFTVRSGETVLLSTPSASGKSTALSVLLGFTAPSSGRVLVGEVDLATVDVSEWRRQLAWVPQRPAFTGGTVAEELALAVIDVQDQAGGPPAESEMREVAAQAAAEHLFDRRIDALSTGERQRVAIARALLRVRRGARLLLLDEPTAHLDPETAARVMTAVNDAARAGAAVVLATHREARSEDVSASVTTERDVVGPSLSSHAANHRLPLLRLLGARGAAGVLLGAAALGCAIALTATSAWLIAKASMQPPVVALSVAVVAVRAFGLGKGSVRYLERLVSHEAAFRLSGALRERLWNALVRLGPARTAGLRRSDGLQRLVDDTDTVRDLVPRVLLPPMVAVLVALAAAAVQAAVLPAAGLTLAVALLVAAVGGPAVALAVERRASAALASGRRRVAATVLVLLDAAADLIASGAQVRVRAELAEADALLAKQARRQALAQGAATALVTLATGTAALACTALAAAAVASGRLDPVLAPLLALVPLATVEALAALPPAAAQRDVLRAAGGRLGELLDAGQRHAPDAPQLGKSDRLVRSTDGSGVAALAVATREQSPEEAGHVRLVGVDVRWPAATALALREVELTIPSGSWVAVVGPSGAGKSTLLAVLLGFLRPVHGHVELPDRVTWCPQEPQLVSTTVRENLRLANPDAGDSALRDALRLAGLASWTDRLDTLVGTGGSSLSGGEAQRLALARALLAANDAGLVLLDEPTAHVDEPTARDLLARLRGALSDRTVLHVTHRPAEAQDADLVVEVMDGRVCVRKHEAA